MAIAIASLNQPVFADEEGAQNLLTRGLLGAGVGAISAGASGGKAGKGALVGAGTTVVGGMLMDTLGGGSSSRQTSRYEDDRYDRDDRYSRTHRRSSRPAYDQASYDKGYEDGYREGYETAYSQAYRDAVRDLQTQGR